MSSVLCVYTPGTLNKMNDMVRFIIATDITLEVGWVLPMTEALGAVPDMFKGRALVRAFSDGYDGRLRVVILAGPVSFAGRGCRDDKMTHIKSIGAQYQ